MTNWRNQRRGRHAEDVGPRDTPRTGAFASIAAGMASIMAGMGAIGAGMASIVGTITGKRHDYDREDLHRAVDAWRHDMDAWRRDADALRRDADMLRRDWNRKSR